MSHIAEAVTALHQRLQELTPEASPEQLAYLAKSIQNIGGQGTLLDILSLTDEKLALLANQAKKHGDDLEATTTSNLSKISDLKDKSLTQIDNLSKDSLVDIGNRRDDTLTNIKSSSDQHIKVIDNTAARHLNNFTKLATINDVPDNSTIMAEVLKQRINPATLPFIFGIVSRAMDHHNWGVGDFTTGMGQWHSGNSENILKILTGCNDWDVNNIGFYRHPQLYFLQGSSGSFVYREMTGRYSSSSNMYSYPHAMLGVFFIKNTTDKDISSNFYVGGSSYWSSGYEGAALHVGVPDKNNDSTDDVSKVNWTVSYSYTSSTQNHNQNASVTIPAGKSIAILFYNSAYYHTSHSNQYSWFLHWYVKDIRKKFLKDGLEFDLERTLKAYHMPGFSNIHEIWN